MKRIVIIILLSAGSSAIAFCTPDTVSIQKAVKQHLVDASFRSKGSHSGNCVELSVNNLTRGSLLLWIEAGRNLVSADSSKQDILIVKDEFLVLAGKAKQKIELFGFCSQSSNGSPPQGMVYNIGHMANEDVQKLARHINNADYPQSAIQSAVWVMTDDKPVYSVHYNVKDSIRNLYKFLATMKDVDLPWYSIAYKEDANRVCTDRPKAVYGEFEYKVPEHGLVSIIIYNKFGSAVNCPLIDVPHDPRSYTCNMSVDVSHWKKETYYVRQFFDGQLQEEKELVVL